ncbi:hypothetical protein EV363DRAFT_1353375 [Boletus edulis]|uniref:Uncharacterized protein n=1 Tax=Boletus edulis BED1 TaxID=1328754 RepID=A0AAD4BA98_BOLED|nr:hypothetical protein EV363DRAFT_1353375 [Boletus edulis]KAF8414781.1 hypothetical protein L210DRAFT_3590451 [Boletus edulis BED1]
MKRGVRDSRGKLSTPLWIPSGKTELVFLSVNTVQGEHRTLIPRLCSFTPDPRPTFAYIATALRDRHPKLAYLHAIEPVSRGMRLPRRNRQK